MDSRSADRFSALFTGATEYHGFYNVEAGPAGSKLLGERGTVREPVTVDLWHGHLDGEQGLGIVPINSDNKVRWAGVDIDRYDLDHKAVIAQVRRCRLPLVLCRSKSGGGHLLVFFQKWASADKVRKHLQTLASALGYGDCEIYPRQSEVLFDRGDLGSWLNIPYFDAEKTMRYAFGDDGQSLTLEEFLDYAEARRMTLPAFLDLVVVDPQDVLQDGPPCLQYLTAQGVPEGFRNKVLFQYGIYAKRKFPDGWEQRLEEYNHASMVPPLNSAEVQNVIKSLSRREYSYSCKEPPCASFCEKGVCQTRAHGVGSGGMPSVSGLSKLDTNPPIWFLSIGADNQRIELTTEALQNQLRFQAACMEQANIMPQRMKDANWQQLIQSLLDQVEIIHLPEDASPEGQFYDLLEQFVSDTRAAARTKDEILLGKPWTDAEQNRVYFRMGDLQTFLDRNKFKEYKRQQIANKVRERCRKAGMVDNDMHTFFNIKGRGVNVWCVPAEATQSEGFDTPAMPKEVI